MKIAIYSDNFYPELSGISDSIIMLARELAKRDHEVHFYVPRYTKKDFTASHVPYKELDLGENIQISRLFSLHYPAATGQARMVIPTGLRAFDAKKFKPDLVHTQLFFGAGLEAISVAKLLKIPLVGTNHTPISEFIRYNPIQAEWGKENMLKYVAWYYNRCDFVTTPSSPLLAEMKEYGFKKPSQVVSNPIDIETYHPVSTAEKKKRKDQFGLSPHTILYTGRLAEEKHVDTLIIALAQIRKTLPDAMLAITGRGTAEKTLKKLAHELNGDAVKFFGMVDVETLVGLYQASDIFAIASTAETQSLSLMQAMATGIPVIGVNAYGLPDYIKPDHGFLIKPHDPVLLATTACELFQDATLLKKMGDNALSYVQQFSSTSIATIWENIYRAAIVKHPIYTNAAVA